MTVYEKRSCYEQFVKRVIDIICSGLALIALSPILLAIAIIVRIKLGSPVIFKQKRPGLHEKIFSLYKFRSMTDARDKDGKLLPDEERLTKFGRVLRSTSLDELPELWNIFKGDMAVVGPRPLLVEYLPYYTDKESHRHDVRPGLTGWAQVNGRNVTIWDKLLQQDLYYVKKCSFILDVKIIFLTIIKVFKRSDILVGAQYGEGHGKLDKVRHYIHQREYLMDGTPVQKGDGRRKRKLLVLGSDFGTIQVVREAHKMGLYVIVSDLMASSPTKELADEAWLISSTDTDTLARKCKEENVSALMFGASDFNVWNARLICKKLNLPIYCESDYACRVARDKGEFKRICKSVGVRVAQDYCLTDDFTEDDLKSIPFPVVVKPVDKSGNRGMSYCSNREELISGYKLARSFSDKEIIVERQLHGKEFNVHYVLADGHARLLYFSSSHHESGEAENLYSFKCTTSHHLKQYIEEVNDCIIAVIEKAECREGIVWVDCIRDEDDGHFYMLEMGYRFGGVMTYVPYEKVTGFNTVKWMLECALGKKHTEEDMPSALQPGQIECAASYNLFSKNDGEIDRIEGLDEVEKIPGVFIDIPKRTGCCVRAYSCMGLLGIYGKDVNEVCDRLKKVNSLLFTLNSKGENMFIKFDDYDALREEYSEGLK